MKSDRGVCITVFSQFWSAHMSTIQIHYSWNAFWYWKMRIIQTHSWPHICGLVFSEDILRSSKLIKFVSTYRRIKALILVDEPYVTLQPCWENNSTKKNELNDPYVVIFHWVKLKQCSAAFTECMHAPAAWDTLPVRGSTTAYIVYEEMEGLCDSAVGLQAHMSPTDYNASNSQILVLTLQWCVCVQWCVLACVSMTMLLFVCFFVPSAHTFIFSIRLN